KEPVTQPGLVGRGIDTQAGAAVLIVSDLDFFGTQAREGRAALHCRFFRAPEAAEGEPWVRLARAIGDLRAREVLRIERLCPRILGVRQIVRVLEVNADRRYRCARV